MMKKNQLKKKSIWKKIENMDSFYASLLFGTIIFAVFVFIKEVLLG